MPSSEYSQIHVDLIAVEQNLAVLRRIVGPDCAICPVLKADGYGLGSAQTARHLKAAGADMLAVFTPGQAAELARSAVGGPILILMPVRELERVDEAYRLLISGRLHLTAHDSAHLDGLLEIAEGFATVIPVHLEVDTGLGRGGCEPSALPAVVERVISSRWLHLAGVCTQFASAGGPASATDQQMTRFNGALRKCAKRLPPDCLVHAANTFATLRNRRYHKTMVRVGLAWTGHGPEWLTAGQYRRVAAELRPVLTWRSRLVQVRTIRKGATVGYGSTWTAPRKTTLGLVPVGYADGYPMALGSRDGDPKPKCVGIEVEPGTMTYVRVIGQVNMDQIAVELTELDKNLIEVGMPVELIGPDPAAPNHLSALARAAGTIPHEILCRLNARIRRIYTARGLVEPKLEGCHGSAKLTRAGVR